MWLVVCAQGWLLLAVLGMKCQKDKDKKASMGEEELFGTEMIMLGKDGKKYKVSEVRT